MNRFHAIPRVFPPAAIIVALWLFTLGGCVEPGYRNEVSTNGQGQVQVHRVAKDSTPPPTVSGAAPAAPVVAPAPANQSIDEQISTLESQVKALNARIDQLKQQKQNAQ